MPTYVYKFVDTGETIEVSQAFTDDTLTEYVHPGTGTSMAVKKVFQPIGVTFKGGGFYKTDSRGGSGSRRPSDASGGSSTDSDSTSSSSQGGSDTSSPSETSSDSSGASTASSTGAGSDD